MRITPSVLCMTSISRSFNAMTRLVHLLSVFEIMRYAAGYEVRKSQNSENTYSVQTCGNFLFGQSALSLTNCTLGPFFVRYYQRGLEGIRPKCTHCGRYLSSSFPHTLSASCILPFPRSPLSTSPKRSAIRSTFRQPVLA